jgi:broad specificity phosphatase PhoE
MYRTKGNSMMNLRVSIRNISLLGLILMMAWGCSHKQDSATAKDKKAIDAAKGSSGFQLILVRHAEAFQNTPDWRPVPDSKLDTLTPRGIKQADAVGKALKESGVQVAMVLTAPTGRASQTAALLMKVLGLQGKPVEDPAVNACQAGESGADKSARIMGAIAKLEQKYTGKTVVIVTHWHLIQCVLDRAVRNEKNGTDKSFKCPPGSMTILHIGKDAWIIEKEPELIGP